MHCNYPITQLSIKRRSPTSPFNAISPMLIIIKFLFTVSLGYGWYTCKCCPYGYHIDLDFVRYCETLGRQVERTGSIKRRKDRRRQRQSMEVLLGLAPQPVITTSEQPLTPIEDNRMYLSVTDAQTVKTTLNSVINDELGDVVRDFERTLQRSKNKPVNNLPDVTAVSGKSKMAP